MAWEGIARDLPNLGWVQCLSERDERVVALADRQPARVSYRLHVWDLPGQARLAFFSLDSEIPRMSTISALLALPPDASDLPILEMNLNWKETSNTLNVILGTRPNGLGPSACRAAKRLMSVSGPADTATFVQGATDDYFGYRHRFQISAVVVAWACATFPCLVKRWLDELRACTVGSPVPGPGVALPGVALAALVGPHTGPGGGFDLVFGEGWLSSLFDSVLKYGR